MTDTSAPDPVMQDAITWMVRVGDGAFADWEEFTAWLEASPAHADAYHAAVADEGEMVEALAAAPPEPAFAATFPPPHRVLRWPRWVGGALAASLVGIVTYNVWGPAPGAQVYETASGAQRTIALDDGSRVILNGATRLLVDRNDARAITLARGEALFSVRHDAARPFRVRVGNADVIDVGTRFDVVRDGGVTRVAVSEGAIDWGGDSPVRVTAGHQLRARDDSAEVELSATAPETVGGWTQGQLDYDGAPLGEVAADLSRTLGVALTVDPAVAARPVRGVIRTGGGASAVVPRLAAVAGVRVHRDGARWRLLALP